MLCKVYEVFDIKYQPFINKFFRKIDLKPPDPKKDDEEGEGGENNEDNNYNINNYNSNNNYNDEVIHTEIDLEQH